MRPAPSRHKSYTTSRHTRPAREHSGVCVHPASTLATVGTTKVGSSMDTRLDDAMAALRSSVDRLRQLVAPLDDDQLEMSVYPAEWTVADVMSHLGSGALIMRRRLEDALAGQPTPDDFAPAVWDEWNAKSARAKGDDALAVDRALVERLDALSDDERSGFEFAMGPVTFDFAGFVGLRLNEHAFHSWDVAVAFDPAAVLAPDATPLVVDQLELVARFTAKPTGDARTITVATTDPTRQFVIELAPDSVTLTPGASGDADLSLAAESFARLVYGRLDPDHTPAVDGDRRILDVLRRVFSGP